MYNDIMLIIFYVLLFTVILWLVILIAGIVFAITVWNFIRPYYILWFLGFAIAAGSYIAWYVKDNKDKWRIHNEKQKRKKV